MFTHLTWLLFFELILIVTYLLWPFFSAIFHPLVYVYENIKWWIIKITILCFCWTYFATTIERSIKANFEHLYYRKKIKEG